MKTLPPNNKTYEELKIDLKQAEEICNSKSKEFDEIHKNDKEFPNWKAYKEFMKPYTDIALSIICQMVPLNNEYRLKPLDDIGDYLKIDEFKENCYCGGFIDYDGFGVLCIGDQQTNIEIYPSMIMHGVDLSKFDGVMWYNK